MNKQLDPEDKERLYVVMEGCWEGGYIAMSGKWRETQDYIDFNKYLEDKYKFSFDDHRILLPKAIIYKISDGIPRNEMS